MGVGVERGGDIQLDWKGRGDLGLGLFSEPLEKMEAGEKRRRGKTGIFQRRRLGEGIEVLYKRKEPVSVPAYVGGLSKGIYDSFL